MKASITYSIRTFTYILDLDAEHKANAKEPHRAVPGRKAYSLQIFSEVKQ